MKFFKICMVVFLVMLMPLVFLGQVKNIGLPKVNNYKRTDYKGGTQNWAIDQDANGNLYFANNSGLLQYDGVNWFKYALPNNAAIRSLKIDQSGKIFVGGNDEFGYFKSNDKGQLVYFSLLKLIPKNKNKNINLIWRIHFYKGEVVFQSFTKAFFYKNGKLRLVEAPNRFQFSFLIHNKLYFQDRKLGILEYQNNTLIPLAGTEFFNNAEIWAMFPLPANKLLIATLEKGLFVYENNTLKPWDTEANAFIKNNTSLGGTIIKNKFIVLNSVLNGIVICDTNGTIVQHLNRQKGLLNNTVLTSFVDNKNNLWLGLDNGIASVNERSPFTYFDYSYNLGTVYASVVHDGNLYVATNQGLFYHAWNLSFKDAPFYRVEGTSAQVWNIQVLNNTLLCASNSGALIIKGNKVVKQMDTKGYFGFKAIPNQTDYCIGQSYNGFTIFKKTQSAMEFVNYIKGYDQITNTFELEIDENYVWFKKTPFLYQMTLADDLTQFKIIKKHTQINHLYKGIGSLQKIGNKVYVQTNNHFYRYSRELEGFFEVKKISKLFSEIPLISTLVEDSFGNLWFAYNESLGVLTKEKNGTYNRKEAPFVNLTGNLVANFIAINTVDPSNIFIGLTDGLAHYDSKISTAYIKKPQAFIESFSFPGDTIQTVNLNLKHKEYELPYSSNHVKFTFSSPTYENQESIKYSYKLEGFDDHWCTWTRMSTKEYTNLSEGSYSMEMKAKNSYGLESEVVKLHFTIRPPWYRHFIAYFFYLILIIGSAYGLYYRMQLKIRRNKYYDKIEQRRLYLEKESRIREEQHELEKEIDRLKSDKLQIKILSKDKELVNNSLQVAKKNKILNGVIGKLKEIDTGILDDTSKSEFNKLHKSIIKEVNADKSWKDLEKHIKNVHFEFLKRLKEKYPTISPRELDLATYLLMNMSTKEIAEIMNISSGGVELARYRLRKKMELNKKENLVGFLMSI